MQPRTPETTELRKLPVWVWNLPRNLWNQIHETTKHVKPRNSWNHKTQGTTKRFHETILSWWNLWLWNLRNLWKPRNLEITKLMKPMKTMREAFLCCREAEEKEKESRGTMGGGTREETREALLSIFRLLLLFFIGIPSGEPLQSREQWILDSLAYVLPSLPFSRSFP